MQIAQDFLSRAPAENPAHSGLCKGFSTGTIGRKDKQDAQVIFEQFLNLMIAAGLEEDHQHTVYSIAISESEFMRFNLGRKKQGG